MRAYAIILAILLACTAADAETGICFLDAFIGLLDGIWGAVNGVLNPTTSTTTTTTVTTSSTVPPKRTTSSVTYTTTTSMTTLTASTTSTTLVEIACHSQEDCPEKSIEYRCDRSGNVLKITNVFFCASPGRVDAECKSRQTQRVEDYCQNWEMCVEGKESCTE